VTILYLADIRFPLERANGIQTMETCAALAQRGHAVRLVVRQDTARPPRDAFAYYGVAPSPRLVVERAPVAGPPPARRLGYLAFALGRGLGAGRADIVFTRDLGVASLLLHLPRRLRPPVVYESHGHAPTVAAELPTLLATASPPSPRKLARLARREDRVWRRADGYVTITRALADDLEARFGPRPALAVVPDGTRLAGAGAAPSPAVPAAGERPVIAYAGHLYGWKGVQVLLDALARVPEADGLIVGGQVGEPDLGRLQAQAAALGIADRVRFTGQVPPGDVAGLLARATALVLPNTPSAVSTRYTSPLKLFEYMAAARPIVASDLPALREVLRHEDTALLVPAGDAAALAAALRRLLDDEVLAARLAGAAREAVARYTWATRAARLESLFSTIASKPA
jgi:glycosyltransferase involved in cell wall biosynthesis